MLNWNFQSWKSRGVLAGSAAVIAAGLGVWLLVSPRGTVPQGFTALNASMAQTIEGTKPVSPSEKPSSPSSSAKTEAKEEVGAGSKQAGAEDSAAGATGGGSEQAPASSRKGAAADDNPAQADQQRNVAGGNEAVPGKKESGGPAADKKIPPGPKIDINTANLQQLMELPGIGESKGKAILAYREQHGKFKRAEQLLDIKGIGEKMLAKMKPYLQINP
ncbi:MULTISPECIES: helix-hairpin-helix domain-containing protein [unclassified Paenibacillus]|uniref:ComEA family DNA-binding protein n=1 Tax=unclassified Paenibacillus TaxID=185978 RepID=UPI00020D792F|nr:MULTISPECIES: helix-hairpin-helix domain-containing protein [unclassified Paenibacillus]EGL16166.1 comEA protein [Paenibacillus sp. HGF7]EPD90296.1 comEA protein [Paenibacillus sp. HGH0039]